MSKLYIPESIKDFIDNLHVKPYKSQDFKTLIKDINESYVKKNEKAENYFIKNIANAYNKQTGKHLIDYTNSKINLSENYNSSINQKVIDEIVSTNDEKKVISLTKNIESYIHKGNTSFLEQKESVFGFKKLAKVRYLDFMNQDKSPVMLTLTLDREFRKYEKIDKNKESVLGEFDNLQEINPDMNLEEIIEKSYIALNSKFRNMYRYFKNLNNKAKDNDKLDFLMIFEPNKSLTIHLHVLFYCNDIQLTNIKKTWDNYTKNLTFNQKKGQDFKIIDTNRAKASTYLSKYIIKAYNNTQEQENNMFFSKFKRYFSKHKLFRTSNFYHTTQAKIDKMYGYLRNTYPDVLKQMRLSDIPLYVILEKMEIDELFMFEETKEEATRIDKKAIEEFYHSNKQEEDDEYVKEELLDNIHMFYKEEQVSKITKAVFIIDNEKMINLLNEFKIDTSEIKSIESEKKFDVFYREGMYDMEKYSLNEAIYIVERKNNY